MPAARVISVLAAKALIKYPPAKLAADSPGAEEADDGAPFTTLKPMTGVAQREPASGWNVQRPIQTPIPMMINDTTMSVTSIMNQAGMPDRSSIVPRLCPGHVVGSARQMRVS